MKQCTFYKMQASGNDFILIDALKKKPITCSYKEFARKYCCRKTAVGADGILVIEPSKKALFKMRIINADGSEAEMCGNGARCAALWAMKIAKITPDNSIKFETIAGVLEAEMEKSDTVKIRVPDPFDLKISVAAEVLGRKMHVNYINTGVPHVVVFVQGIEAIHVNEIGRAIRFHKKFAPKGANVNFVEVLGKDSIKIRTYERGVEEETLSCGTGSIASAIITSCIIDDEKKNIEAKIKAHTRGKENLIVYFKKEKAKKISDVWLQGLAALVYLGICEA
jgi:diaminopimelate epimerase